MQKDRQLLSLAQLKKEHEKSKSSERLMSTIGLIIDCSNIYRYENNRDFTQKLKIIDHSQQQEPLQVYLWSNRKEDFTLSLKVGDIILLNNFKIESFHDKLQAKKAYRNEDSYFRIFSGSPDINSYFPIDKKVGLDDDDGKILNSLSQLRAFSKTHFSKNRVPVLSKNDKKVSSSDCDVVLRVVECLEMSNHCKLKLTNGKDEFHLNYTRRIENGVYKVRSVADFSWEDKVVNLAGNDYTFFLEIPPWMLSHDPKEWERIVVTPSKKKMARRERLDTKVVSSKKVKKMDLKTLFSKGTPGLRQMSTSRRCG